MGDRVVMQCHSRAQNVHGPAVYGHWLGSEAPKIVAALIKRMQPRRGDVDYASARLVQEFTLAQGDHTTPSGSCMGIGLWNVDHLLTPDDSHGDAGCVLINVDDWTVQYFGGYLLPDSSTKSTTQQADDAVYAALGANG
jgi:hypothetical protein